MQRGAEPCAQVTFHLLQKHEESAKSSQESASKKNLDSITRYYQKVINFLLEEPVYVDK